MLDFSTTVLDFLMAVLEFTFYASLFLLGCWWLLNLFADCLLTVANRLDESALAGRPAANRARADESAHPRRAVWIEKWARIHSAALKTTRWRLRRLRRGRFALRPNRAPHGGRSGICCAVCARRPCVCNVVELGPRGGASIVGVRGAVEQSASEGLGCEPGFRRTFRGGAGSGRRPAGF